MKKTLLTIAVSIISLAATYAQQAKLQPGDGMPRVSTEMKDAINGGNKAYYSNAGKNGLLVMFSCNTCPFVVKNEQTILKTIEYAKANGIGVVIINSNEAKRDGDDSYDAMKKYAQKQGFNVPYLVDENSKLADAFGANHTPEIFLFSKENKLVYKGAMNDNAGNPSEAKVVYVNNAIDAMIAGREINPNTTKSIGCSIKRKS